MSSFRNIFKNTLLEYINTNKMPRSPSSTVTNTDKASWLYSPAAPSYTCKKDRCRIEPDWTLKDEIHELLYGTSTERGYPRTEFISRTIPNMIGTSEVVRYIYRLIYVAGDDFDEGKQKFKPLATKVIFDEILNSDSRGGARSMEDILSKSDLHSIAVSFFLIRLRKYINLEDLTEKQMKWIQDKCPEEVAKLYR